MSSVTSATEEAESSQQRSAQSSDWTEDTSDTLSEYNDRIRFNGDGLNTGVRVLGDGRLDIRIKEHRPNLAGLLNRLQATPMQSECDQAKDTASTCSRAVRDGKNFPLVMNVVIQVIGSRGDIQPFVALGKELKAHGHRVRLATHFAFREFVLEGGLEFFNIGGDPAELMAFMVKNPGLLPGLKTIRSGAIQKRRREMKEIIHGCWRSCYEMGDGTDLHQIKNDLWGDTTDYRRRPFVADAIIANPPSLAHIHCAQRLGVPLHIMFTMPWSPTQSFPHPLAILHQQNCKPTVANFVSYAVVDMMVWEGLGDLVNTFRKKSLALDALDHITAPSLIHRLQIPCSYLWSPAVLPKPIDWGENIDICGFSFLPSESDYKPTAEIDAFLKAGPTPIYVGFGSIVVDDQTKLTKMIFEAVKMSGQRAIISKGWGNLGVDEVDIPENILLIGSCPHDWLFRHVSCVIHHGGAGTTAAGLALARPTIIIPFFGDQEFWGGIVARAGAGPRPIPHKHLTADKLKDAIEMALKEETQVKAQAIAQKMKQENGVRDGVRSFHRQLNLRSLRCCVCPIHPAVWHLKRTQLGFSAFAAAVLVEMGRLKPEDLVLSRAMEYDTYRDPIGPLSASAQVLFGAISGFVTGLADVPVDVMQDLVSAGRAIGHAHTKPKFKRKWDQRPQNEDELASDPSSSDHAVAEAHQEQNQLPDSSDEGAEVADDHEDDGMMEDWDNQFGEDALFPESELERNHSLELEKTQTMGEQIAIAQANSSLREAANHGRRMSMKFVNLIIWLPTDVSLSLSKGFHNAPKLYHDPMVRSTPKVKGLRSGLRAAGTEFRYGWYDGLTGLVTQPQHGYRDHGAKGMFKGIGKGIGGVFLKPPAALWGLAGYPLTGLRRRLLKSLGKNQECQIILSRIAQGHEDMRASTPEQRARVVRKWDKIEASLMKNKDYSGHCPTQRVH
ncbi:uncharacterized protein N7503_004446 [Penicillium pulvis]|uniref:uncharacterized protein n=1 Tax=Penicillium pulvis TaxID=1562058 RepID=UPI0025489355|nr:uncharacterized protein N7503_004446 [Penicillium pulvis]KAJ5801996.1 hypothetical protein N7503_004446 [Penicillium pulvis]